MTVSNEKDEEGAKIDKKPKVNVHVELKEKRKSSLEAFQEMLKRDGISSFYKGLRMAVLGTVISSGSYFFCYRFWKNVWMQYSQKKEH